MLSLSPRRIRTAWQRVCPIPLPRYRPGTPRVGGAEPKGMFELPDPLTVAPTFLTLAEAAASPEAAGFVADLIDRLSPDEESAAFQRFYRGAQARFGKYWRYIDLYTVLWAAATLMRPRSYLEIGVRRGRSTAVVGGLRPECAIYGFDLWASEYAGTPNPGPDFVRDELTAAGHQGPVELISGDSKEAVPAFLREHPELYFDLITIDGDKSLRGFASDFANALPRLKVGGIILTDDLPYAPILMTRVWRKFIMRDGRYVGWTFSGGGGVVAAIRISDEPWFAAMQ